MSSADIADLEDNPWPWDERLAAQQLEHEDDSDSPFKYREFDAALTGDLGEKTARYIGHDVAGSGLTGR